MPECRHNSAETERRQGDGGAAAPKRSLWRDRCGGVAVLVAFSLPVVVGAVGIGVETSLWYAAKNKARAAADASALAGARAKSAGINSDTAKAVGHRDAARNGFVDGVGGASVTVNIPPVSGPNIETPAAVEVIVSVSVPSLVRQYFGTGATTVTARSVAAMTTRFTNVEGSSGCLLALHPTADSAILMSGSGTIDVKHCFIAANSTSASGLYNNGSGAIKAFTGYFGGNYDLRGSGSITFTVPPQVNFAAGIADPYDGKFASITLPSSCLATNFSTSSSATTTIRPGRYCGGIGHSGSGTLSLDAGTYYMDGGDFTVSGSGSVTCGNCDNGAGVTIVLTSSGSASTIGRFRFTGGGSLYLPAPMLSAGQDYPGIAILQDPRASTTGTAVDISGGLIRVSGAIYTPQQHVSMTGGVDTAPGRQCMTLIARTIGMSGSGTILTTDCGDMGVSVPTSNLSTLALVE